jgi:hypothetical protein
MVFPLVNKYFVNNGGNDTLQFAGKLVFGPCFVLAKAPTYGENNVEVLLQEMAQLTVRKRISTTV